MKLNPKALLIAGCFLITATVSAQKTAVKFGDISPKDFEPQTYAIDKDARAVILYDVGSAEYQTNGDGIFEIAYKYHYRIRLLNKSAFDRATIQFALYKNGSYGDRLDNLEAATYNIENGKVVKTKVDKQSVFTDKAAEFIDLKKFTFPDLKEGCIIEYTMKIISPNFLGLRDWVFQDAYPVLRSEYEVTVPYYFDYIFLTNGYYTPAFVADEGTQLYSMSGAMSRFSGKAGGADVNVEIRHSKWTMDNLPAMVKEKYTTTLANHLSKIEFELRSIEGKGGYSQSVIRTWEEMTGNLLKSERFGKDVFGLNKWMKDEIKDAWVSNDTVQTAENIFKYVRDNFTCTDYTALRLSGTLKKAYEAKKGNVADINLVLTSMLRQANIKADPLILSTRDNGFAYETYPLPDKFNYVITRAVINNKEYLMDASVKKIGFNHLPDYCYNGYARIVSENPELVNLSADSLAEIKTTSIFINNPEDGKKEITGHVSTTLGYIESYNLRKKGTADNKDELLKEIKKGFSSDMDIKEAGADFLDSYNDNAEVHYDFTIPTGEDIIYFSPLMSEAYKANPFTAANRNYPVEMPYRLRETIIVNMEIPKGYKIDELPKSVKINLNDNAGSYEYIVISDANSLQVKSKLNILKANFPVDDYENLREFYSYIVKKQAEQIVFKKL